MKATIKFRFQRFVGRPVRRRVAAVAALAALAMATSPVDSQPPPKNPVFTDSTEVHFVPFFFENTFDQEAVENTLHAYLAQSAPSHPVFEASLFDGDIDVFGMEDALDYFMNGSSQIVMDFIPGGFNFDPDYHIISRRWWASTMQIGSTSQFTMPPAHRALV